MKHLAKIPFGTLAIAVAMLVVSSCNEDDKPKTLPEVTTFDESDVTTTTVTVGGEITSDGNDEILSSGIVYSNENDVPTLEALDAFVEGELLEEGEFNLELSNLESGTTYKYRAYAVNSKGVGYGEVKDFTLGNAAPVATNVEIDFEGDFFIGTELTSSFDYEDAEGDPEGTAVYQWYKAEDASGTNEVAIAGATSDSYIIVPEDEFRFIRVGVKPKATSGTDTGVEVKSTFTDAVPEGVTFTYNGQTVTYGIITSSETGRRWMDRNLGAPNKPTAHNDNPNYGDLFQWGRDTDGHQLINRVTNAAINGTTPTKFTSTSTSSNLFYIDETSSNSPLDWLTPQNNGLWQGANGGSSNPCPDGWHIPTRAEWNSENIRGKLNNVQDAYTLLNITLTGYRRGESGVVDQVTSYGFYWSSNPIGVTSYSFYFWGFNFPGGPETDAHRYNGLACRCIKNE